METLYTFETDSESGVFGTFILRRVRELFGVDSYVETVPRYAERLGLSVDDLKSAIRGEILPDIKIIRDMMLSDTMRLEVSQIYKYRVSSISRYPGFKID